MDRMEYRRRKKRSIIVTDIIFATEIIAVITILGILSGLLGAYR
ncbi:MAG: hypothetical protein VB031_07670 [Eubacteriaceae bacterium]|nr:hypothetical protein [Eubacteriaceae bacterium]